MVSSRVSVALLALLLVAASLATAEDAQEKSCNEAAKDLQSYAEKVSNSLLSRASSPFPDPTSLLNCFSQNATNISALIQCILSKITGSAAVMKAQNTEISELISSLQEQASSLAEKCS